MQSFGQARPDRRPPSTCRRYRPVLEELEGRSLLSSAPQHPAFLEPLFRTVTPDSGAAPSGYTPAQIRHAYDFDSITFAGGTVTGNGSGQTIAIVDAYDDPNIVNDLHAFDQQFGLPDPTFSRVAQNGSTRYPGTDPTGGWEMEESLDVEWAHAMAPAARILLVEAADNSWNNLMAAVSFAARQSGVSVVSMSFGGGEDPTETGSDSLFTTPVGHQGVTFVASSGDSGTISYPAASPNVLGVGGTSLFLNGSSYAGETAWSGSGGGLSQYEPLPGYQQAVLGGLSGTRGSPDVAYNADPNTGFAVYDSFDNPSGPWTQVGGTSAGAPQWSALLAIANQGRALNGQGSLDGPSQTLPMIYALAGSGFHDVTSGSNGDGYTAGPGYDLVTGWGSPDAAQVVAQLAGQPQSPGSTLSATGQNVSATAGSSFTGVVAVVRDTFANVSAGNFSVTITWGDGGSSAGTVTANADGTFSVSGTHTYTQAGSYTVTVQVQDVVNKQTATAQALAAVAPNPAAPTQTTVSPPIVVTTPVQPPQQQAPQPGVFVQVVRVKGRFQVQVLDLNTGLLLFTLSPFSSSVRRTPQVLLLDLNGDGVADWLLLAQQGKRTVVVALDGIDGSPLF
jgi:subtilase family serine protease